MNNDTKPMTYEEFMEWSVQQLTNAVITGGFPELKRVFRYTVMNVLCMNIRSIFPHLTTVGNVSK